MVRHLQNGVHNRKNPRLEPMDLLFTTLNATLESLSMVQPRSRIRLDSYWITMRAVCWSELFAISRFPLLQFLRHVWLSLNAGFTVSCALPIHQSQLRRALSQCGAPRSPYSRISDVTDRLFFSMWLGCCSNSLCPILQLIRRLKNKQKKNDQHTTTSNAKLSANRERKGKR